MRTGLTELPLSTKATVMSSENTLIGPDRDGNYLQTEGSKIRTFGPSPSSVEVAVSCPDGQLKPGRVCAHTHLYSGLAPLGLPAPEIAPENFVQILERVWWRLDRALDARSLDASARYYIANALLDGTTSLVDHHESPNFIEGSLDVLGTACTELGMRAALCFGATERNGGVVEGRRGLAECARFVKSNHHPLLRGLVGLHASFTVSDSSIEEAGRLCRELGVGMHIHVAEADSDVADAKERGYESPFDRLVELGGLPPRSVLVHGVHATREQVLHGEKLGAWWVHNPRSNKGNRVGYASALSAANDVALGTDGYPAKMLEEQQALFEEAEAAGDSLSKVKSRQENGAKMVGMLFDLPLGQLVPGAAADVIVEGENGVMHVLVDGEWVVRDGRLVNADLAAIKEAAEQEAPRLWSLMATYQ